MDFRNRELSKIDVIFYTVLIIVFFVVFNIERKDNICPAFTSNAEKCECKGWNGMPWRDYKADASDSVSKLLKKIDGLAGSEERMIKWRRSFTLSFAISILFWSLVMRELPPVEGFALTVLVGFSVLYYSFNYYSFHITSIPRDMTYEATALVRQKLKRKT